MASNYILGGHYSYPSRPRSANNDDRQEAFKQSASKLIGSQARPNGLAARPATSDKSASSKTTNMISTHVKEAQEQVLQCNLSKDPTPPLLSSEEFRARVDKIIESGQTQPGPNDIGLRGKITFAEFLETQACLEVADASFVSLEYCEDVGILVWDEGSLHSEVKSGVAGFIHDATTSHNRARVIIKEEGGHQRTIKNKQFRYRADVACLRKVGAHSRDFTTIIEVGVSQTLADLRKKAKNYLTQPSTISLVILIDICEEKGKDFKLPEIPVASDDILDGTQLPLEISADDLKNEDQDDEWSALSYSGYILAPRLESATIELWDPSNLQNGYYSQQFIPQLPNEQRIPPLSIGQIFNSGKYGPLHNNNNLVDLTHDNLRELVIDGRRIWAADRYYASTMGSKDEDYNFSG